MRGVPVMMMALGQFVFSLQTAAYQQLQRNTQYRQASSSRVGERPAMQFVGPGDDAITLDGTLLPEVAGQRDTIEQLRDMASEGDAWVLVDGGGTVHGAYVITRVNETQSAFLRDGTARKIDFSLSLKRVDDGEIARNQAIAGPTVGGIDQGGRVAHIA